ncbi:MAG TPA: hypothetical protein VK932_22295 [Kofleriaceae bacterium]|nr:hypothetical protein [Kofleriaceae bacterium]
MRRIITSIIVIATLWGCGGSGAKSVPPADPVAKLAASDAPVLAMSRVAGVRMASMPLGADRQLFIKVDAVWACDGTTCEREDAALTCEACLSKGCDCAKPLCAPVCLPYDRYAAALTPALASSPAGDTVPTLGPEPAEPIPSFGVIAVDRTTVLSLPIAEGKHVFLQAGGAWACTGAGCTALSPYEAGCDCRLTACKPVCRPQAFTADLATALPRLGEVDPTLSP